MQSLSALHGRWKLVYTSHPQTLLLLTALDSLPLVDVGDVYQVVDTSAMAAYNKVLAGLEIPDQLTVLGAAVDLTPLKRLIQDPLASGLGTARALLGAVAPQAASQVGDATSLWMLTTYLDDSLRISRDDNGAVFVMLKEITLYDESGP
ncbi:plastid lipid associated protein [Haematococcus lacustris]|uniref:Plastid lipid associated protein n=1 Tax=Haematococcus lacustris TaxID=44745 RepID=A0A699YF00_HAELA|nr:plastid lipid associated protein [Haematococcus lacustris]